MNPTQTTKISVLLALMLAITACQPGQPPVPTITSMPATSTPTLAAASTDTPTAVPFLPSTDTPAPTQTQTPAPTSTAEILNVLDVVPKGYELLIGGEKGVFQIRSESNQPVQLVKSKPLVLLPSPNGEWFFYGNGAQAGLFQISERTELPFPGYYTEMGWSPDGNQFVYRLYSDNERIDRLIIRDLKSRQDKDLFKMDTMKNDYLPWPDDFVPDPDRPLRQFFTDLSWSPDGRWVGVSIYNIVTQALSWKSHFVLKVSNPEAGPSQLTEPGRNGTGGPMNWVDGSTFAYTKFGPGCADRLVYVVTVVGEQIPLPLGDFKLSCSANPQPSPDGRYLAVIEHADYPSSIDPRSVLIYDLIAHKIKQKLSVKSGSDNLAWSPDSAYLLVPSPNGFQILDSANDFKPVSILPADLYKTVCPDGGYDNTCIPTFRPVINTEDCTAGWARLAVSGQARVMGDSTSLPNRVRSGPAKKDKQIGEIYPGTVVKVLQGPVCADGLVFWKVSSDEIPGGVGWTAEGDGKEYWLEPYKKP